MTKQIKIDVLDVGFHLWTDDEKQHGYTNLTDLLDGLRGLLSGAGDGWRSWDGSNELPDDVMETDIVDIHTKNGMCDCAEAHTFNWFWHDNGLDITRYRVVRS